jgi:peptidoglycan L-alanyl-D-glutamate endopeptidase CwlK
LFAGYVVGIADRLYEQGLMTKKVRWGGDWDKDWEASDNTFDDFPHFELLNVEVIRG